MPLKPNTQWMASVGPDGYSIWESPRPDPTVPPIAVGIQQQDIAEFIAAAPKTDQQRDQLLEVVDTYLMSKGHFYDCIPGSRGGDPNDDQCSLVCTKLRAAIAITE